MSDSLAFIISCIVLICVACKTIDYAINSFSPNVLERWCIGAGVDLITACDIRIAASDAIFSVKEVILKKNEIP